MPLVRFEVKNEYGLGDPELYRGTAKKDDPRALLDGVAVAGLVGILRQLGDLAEFAADIFHDLHEQVVATSSRGRKMMTRIQFIESKLPSLERAVQNQTSHIHFSYVAGTNWHANVRTDESHLLCSDLPRFIMDSYEECREPPRLYLLDKFDSSGPGACLKRYSDPSYFKRVCVVPQLARAEKAEREKKVHRSKRRGMRHRHGDIQHSISIPHHNVSAQIASPASDVQSFSTETTVTSDMRLKPEDASESTSFCLKTRLDDFQRGLGDTKPSALVDQQDYRNLPVSELDINHSDPCTTVLHSESRDGADYSQPDLLQEKNVSRLPWITWDEKTEILEPTSSGSLERDHGGPCAFVSRSEQREDVADDDPQQDSLQERIVNRLPSVTWDEKAEILKPISPSPVDGILASQVESSDPSPVCLETSNFDDENYKLGRGHPFDQEDSLFDIANLPAPLSGGNHFDENNSETDNYTDALNTMESETETDSDYQTKREVTSMPSCNYTKAGPGNGMTEQMVSSSSDSSDSDIAIGSHSSVIQDESLKLQNLDPSGTSDHVESAHIPGLAPNSDDNNGKDFSEHCPVDLLRMTNSEVGDVDLSQGFVAPILPGNLSNGTMTNTSEGHGYPGDAISLPPVNFWTNGGLLGVEPSKPPDFSFPDVSNENAALGTAATGGYTSSHMETNKLQNGGSASLATDTMSGSLTRTTCSMENIDKSFGFGTSIGQACNVAQHDISAVKQISHQPLQSPSVSALENYPDTHSHSHTGSSYPSKVDEFGSGAGLPAASNVESQASDSGQTSMSISSSISGLAQRFLSNSLQRRTSLMDAESSGTSGMVSPVIRKSQENFARNRNEAENFEIVSNVRKTADKVDNRLLKKSLSYRYSEQSSPPLEEMKISFHPINQYETSKLKLDFSNHSFRESCEDLDFPSFQLLPGPSIPVADDISDSDDDTFCRSCPYSSEDLLSPRSYSNSELWDQDGRDADHEKSEESHRSSTSAASVSSHTGFGHINGQNLDPADIFVKLGDNGDDFSFQSNQVVDLPGFDSIGFQKGTRQETYFPVDPEDPAPLSTNEMPALPPLPPMQWRTTKPDFISVEDNSSVITEVDDHLDSLPSLKSTAGRDQEQNRVTKSIANPNEKQHDEQKMNGKREANHAVHYKESDDKEDFLQQIRSKSFNLRRTETTRPPLVLQPTTNVNVAAILEKANAIRQACVGSDDGGDDDTWSDA